MPSEASGNEHASDANAPGLGYCIKRTSVWTARTPLSSRQANLISQATGKAHSVLTLGVWAAINIAVGLGPSTSANLEEDSTGYIWISRIK